MNDRDRDRDRDHERVIKHLEFIQSVINRLGSDSFLPKGWSVTVLVAGALLMVRFRPDKPLFVLTLLIPVVGFWLLEAYFLQQERLFRAEYDRVRQQDETDFAMNPMQHKDLPKHSRSAAFFSETLVVFYGIEILFVAFLVGFSLWTASNPTSGSCCP